MSLANFLLAVALCLCSALNLVEYGMGWDSDGACPYPCNQPPSSTSIYPIYGAPPPPPAPPSQVNCPPAPPECCQQPPPSPPYPSGGGYGIPPPYPYGMVPAGAEAAACHSSVVFICAVVLVVSYAVVWF